MLCIVAEKCCGGMAANLQGVVIHALQHTCPGSRRRRSQGRRTNGCRRHRCMEARNLFLIPLVEDDPLLRRRTQNRSRTSGACSLPAGSPPTLARLGAVTGRSPNHARTWERAVGQPEQHGWSPIRQWTATTQPPCEKSPQRLSKRLMQYNSKRKGSCPGKWTGRHCTDGVRL